MDGQGFGLLTKYVAKLLSRRKFLRATGVGLSVAGLAGFLLPTDDAGAYSNSCRKFTISGGKRIKKKIDVDDDLTIWLLPRQGKRKRIFHDNDGEISNGLRPIKPIKFRARVGDRLRIVATDVQPPCRSLRKLFLHCRQGGRPKRLTRGYQEKCNSRDGVFFDERFRI